MLSTQSLLSLVPLPSTRVCTRRLRTEDAWVRVRMVRVSTVQAPPSSVWTNLGEDYESDDDSGGAAASDYSALSPVEESVARFKDKARLFRARFISLRQRNMVIETLRKYPEVFVRELAPPRWTWTPSKRSCFLTRSPCGAGTRFTIP